jgi:tRNA G18 (ribose-2'-O)-methylase SpoU
LWYVHNISAIFRTVEAAGLKNIIVVGETSQKKINSNHIDFKCYKYLNIEYCPEIEEPLQKLKKNNFKIYATYMTEDTVDMWSADYNGKIALVLGTEKYGVSETVLQYCDKKIWIPTLGLTRSLNVSVSTAVLIYEIIRKKRFVYNEITEPVKAPYMVYPGERK